MAGFVLVIIIYIAFIITAIQFQKHFTPSEKHFKLVKKS